MAASPENTSMALFCDFENVALGVRDAKYEKFDIKRVLERLLLKGSIVVKKAYCDWERYKGFKATMHEANFELIEIPHVRQSGKNSADIRLVVDALDLCYTKSHVDTFVIISGDSDFSPLVSKLRENAKQVIGVGVKQSTSDLLIANCDEFIFYDDLVREGQRAAARRAAHEQQPANRRPHDDDSRRREDGDGRRAKAIDLAVETLEALGSERGDGGKIRTSVLKDAIKRRKPDFNETYFGFRSFGSLLEEAQTRGLLELVRDEKGNAYVQRGGAARMEPPVHDAVHEPTRPHAPEPAREEARQEPPEPPANVVVAQEPAPEDSPRGRGRGAGRKTARPARGRGKADPAAQPVDAAPAQAPAPFEAVAPAPAPAPEPAQAPAACKSARKTSTRARRPRKQAPEGESA